MLARMQSSLFLFGCFLLALVPFSSQAQIHGVPASVTSFGFGGNMSPTPGVAASVTSLGPNGFGRTPPIFAGCCFHPFRGTVNPGFHMGPNSAFFHNHGFRNHAFSSAVPVYAVPYTPVVVVQSDGGYSDAVAEDEEDGGGSALFDRRGSHDNRQRRRAADLELEHEPDTPAAAAAPAKPEEPITAQPSTLLLFKDGHKAEVLNYAIVGDTLFDLNEGRTKKIQLADLDLPATLKANEDRGVDFQMPARASR
jgi:hypothetical protein